MVITDAAYNTPVWVNPLAPETWIDELRSHLGSLWEHERTVPEAPAAVGDP